MAYFPSYKVVIIMTLAILLVFLRSSSAYKLADSNFYSNSCPKLFDTVKSVVQKAIDNEARMGASLLRLHFHDCFLSGCDGSLLLDDTPTFNGEKSARPNLNSARGFDVVDNIKSALEMVCPGVVSCADILAIAARDSVVALGGPNWNVTLARRDAKTANLTAANNGAISPASNLTTLINRFNALNLSNKDLVALSGAHTIGQARCITFRDRIYNETNYNLDGEFSKRRQVNCPAAIGSGDNNSAPLDLRTPVKFDNNYYKNLVEQKGLLHSDQQLFIIGDNRTNYIVETYSNNQSAFYEDFAVAMIKMGDINPLTGKNGEIRKNCRSVN